MRSLILGTFDGVHAGHRALLDAAAGTDITVSTFLLPPACFFTGQAVMLTDRDEKERLLKKAGANEVYFQSFDASFTQIEATDYMRALVKRFRPSMVLCGLNHRFGKDAAGGLKLLNELGTELGFEVRTVLPQFFENAVISSTEIRKSLLDGDCARARGMLGRPYRLTGIVTEGKKLGQTLQFPTANLQVKKEQLLPKEGVYATCVYVDGMRFSGMTNIGSNPTVNGRGITVETHIVNFNGNLYSKQISVDFLARLRDEKKFGSMEELKCQLALDREMSCACQR